MSFMEQRSEEDKVLFVDWGELKAGHSPETNIVVKEGEYIEGIVKRISDNEVYKKILVLKTKEHDKDVMVLGCKSLLDGLGYGDKIVEPVGEGDLVRIRFDGMYKTKSGGRGYGLTVLVDRPEKKSK